MSDRFVELTRIDRTPKGEAALVNLSTVAWFQASSDGSTSIVFAAAVPHERANGVPLSITVRESLEDVVKLVGVVRKTDRDAIAQAWADQSVRRENTGGRMDDESQ